MGFTCLQRVDLFILRSYIDQSGALYVHGASRFALAIQWNRPIFTSLLNVSKSAGSPPHSAKANIRIVLAAILRKWTGTV